MRLGISDLTRSGLTRRNGQRAARELLARDDGTELVIDLDDSEFLSLSFLDEFVQRLAEAGTLDRLSFVTRQEGRLGKLGRVCDAGEVVLHQLVAGERLPVERKAPPKLVEVRAADQPPEDPW